MKIYFINSCSSIFKYNKTKRLNLFNKNIILYNKYCSKNINSKNSNDFETCIEKQEKKINQKLYINNLNKSENNLHSELELRDFKNSHNEIQLRLYEKHYDIDKLKNNQNSLIDGSHNSLVKKEIGELTRIENIILLKNQLDKEEKIIQKERYQKSKIGISLFILLVGLFSLWIPLYKTICESQGFSVKTNHVDYKFQDRKLNVTKKFTVKFIDEVDVELPWEFKALQEKVVINAGETCLIFYRARNKTDKPIVGLSVYDVHPQSLAFYFNKIQCFCFENQMLGPYEEVDLPVFFYIDPSVNDDGRLEDFSEFILKYTFYYAKRQDLAQVMLEHLTKEKKDQEKLKERKIELNKMGKKYTIEETNKNISGLPGINPLTSEYKIEELQQYLNSVNSEFLIDNSNEKHFDNKKRNSENYNDDNSKNDDLNRKN